MRKLLSSISLSYSVIFITHKNCFYTIGTISWWFRISECVCIPALYPLYFWNSIRSYLVTPAKKIFDLIRKREEKNNSDAIPKILTIQQDRINFANHFLNFWIKYNGLKLNWNFYFLIQNRKQNLKSIIPFNLSISLQYKSLSTD